MNFIQTKKSTLNEQKIISNKKKLICENINSTLLKFLKYIKLNKKNLVFYEMYDGYINYALKKK